MLVHKILKVVLLLLGATYVILQGFTLEKEGDYVSTIALILLTWLYLGWTKHRSQLFTLFLLFFTGAQLIGLFSWYREEIPSGDIDYLYFIANILSIISYALLIIKMCVFLKLKTVFSQFTIPIIILVILDVFCVTLISGTTENAFTFYEYALEFTYNAVVMILVSVALINYMYRNNYKSMLFLLGSIFIVFSEIIQLAYYYIVNNDANLGYIYSLFLVVAFIFYYLQSQHKVSEPTPAYTDDALEA